MSYHKLDIHKHLIGSPYKIQEEFLEYIDAVATDNKIMAVQELSDLYGCLEKEVAKYGMDIKDLKVMSDLTKEVFKKGTRSNEDFLEYLKGHCEVIQTTGLGFIQLKCGDINYNFYHKSLNKYHNYDKPHNHQRDYVSEIVKGSLVETIYKIDKGSNKAHCACGDGKDILMLDYEIKEVREYRKGDLYLRLKNEYHSVEGNHGTITKFTKYGHKQNAYVISDEFGIVDNAYTLEELWCLVEEAYNV